MPTYVPPASAGAYPCPEGPRVRSQTRRITTTSSITRSSASRRAALDVLGRRGYRQLRQRPPVPRPRHAAAQGRRADRGDAELLHLRRPAPPRARSVRGATSRSPAAPGTPSTAWPGSASWQADRQTAGPPSNLVFLIDVSGSMSSPTSSRWSSRRCRSWSSSSARTTGWRSSSTPAPRAWCSPPRRASASRDPLGDRQLQAGGSTNGGAGIQLAYDIAVQNYIKKGTNRVILCHRRRLQRRRDQ